MSPVAAEPVATPLRTAALPDWFHGWARELAELYYSGTTCLFVLHGNVHDLIRCPRGGEEAYCSLPEFLATQVFGSWDVVLHHDLGRGLRPLAGDDARRLQAMVQQLPSNWPRDPDELLAVLDRYIDRTLVEDDAAKRKSIGIVFDYAQYLLPAGDLGSLARGQGVNLVRMLGWAQNPYIKRANIAFCLVADKLQELNERLVNSPHVAAIQVPLPDRDERERFCRKSVGDSLRESQQLAERVAHSADGTRSVPTTTLDPAELAELSNGLSLINLNVVLSQGRQNSGGVDHASFRRLKKTLIERQCQGLLEFLEPKHKLDMLVGQAAAKQRLHEDADLLLRGRLDAAPMGYLFCGAVGTGKTFLAECYAGSVGIPCVKLRNFRSKYVGETEGNLEQVLTVLRSLGPVVVIIDEADAALGTRQAEGDSGTSSRVFGMIASQMGDTQYRGRIVWMLLTSRPDLLPIDLKRQGRAEVHIPLFYPQDEAEIREMFLVMARKNKAPLATDALPKVGPERHLSGADIESIVLAAKRRALTAGRADVQKDDIDVALAEFVPSAQGLEKEAQELAAVLECTQMSFLPPEWRAKVAEPNGRTLLQERLVAIRQLLKE